jgi:hypothetical protein
MSDDDDELDGKVDEKTINADEITKTMGKGTWEANGVVLAADGRAQAERKARPTS